MKVLSLRVIQTSVLEELTDLVTFSAEGRSLADT